MESVYRLGNYFSISKLWRLLQSKINVSKLLTDISTVYRWRPLKFKTDRCL